MRTRSFPEAGASVSVFLLLAFSVLFAFLLTVYDGASRAGSRAYAELMLSAAGESLQGEYCKALYDRYGLLALDMAAGGAVADTASLSGSLAGYVSDGPEGLSATRLQVTETKAYLADGVKTFKEQAVAYEKSAGIPETVEGLLQRIGLLSGTADRGKAMKTVSEAELELAKADRYTVKLMELIDGVCVGGLSGLFSSGSGSGSGTYGSCSAADTFFKRMFPGEATASAVGINNREVFELLSGKYRDPYELLERICQDSLAYEVALGKLTAPGEDTDTALERTRLVNAAKSAERDVAEFTALYGETLKYAELALEAAEDAVSVLDASRPLVEKCEALLGTESGEELLSTDLGRTVAEMKAYVGLTDGGRYDSLVRIIRTLRGDIEALRSADVRTLLGNGSDEILGSGLLWYRAKELKEVIPRLSYDGLVFDYSGFSGTTVKGSIAGIAPGTLADGILSYLLYGAENPSEAVLDGTLLLEKPSEDGADDSALKGLVSQSPEASELFGEASFLESLKGLLGEAADAVSEQALMTLYYSSLFESYRAAPQKGCTVLSYEKEYLINGNRSDKVNLSSVAGRILLIRLVPCAVFVFSDAELKGSAEVLAAGLLGFTGMPFLVSAAKYLILSVLAVQQALIETSAIMRGKKVPVLTDRTDCMVSVGEMLTLTGEALAQKASGIAEGKVSLTYDDYLFILLLAGDDEEMAVRALDLIQSNIRYADSGDFLFANCISGFTATGLFSDGRRLYRAECSLSY